MSMIHRETIPPRSCNGTEKTGDVDMNQSRFSESLGEKWVRVKMRCEEMDSMSSEKSFKNFSNKWIEKKKMRRGRLKRNMRVIGVCHFEF